MSCKALCKGHSEVSLTPLETLKVYYFITVLTVDIRKNRAQHDAVSFLAKKQFNI